MALKNLFVGVAVGHDNESQVRHRNVQRNYCCLISAMRSSSGSKGTSRFAVKLTLKPQTTQAVDECFQLRRRVAKARGSSKYDSVCPLCVAWCRCSVVSEHSLAA